MNQKINDISKLKEMDAINNIHYDTIVSKNMPKNIEEQEEVQKIIEIAINNLRRKLEGRADVKNR